MYLDDLREIGYMLVHEATHVAYERIHGPMSAEGLDRPGRLRHLACTLIQNEGLAVYSALQTRKEGNCLDNQDYRALLDPPVLAKKTADLRDLLQTVTPDYPGERAADEVLERLSGERLSYVVGCSGFVGLQRRGGLPLVRQAIAWTPEEFVARTL